MSVRIEPCFEPVDPSCCSCWESATPAAQERSRAWAQEIIWRLSGRQFGLCDVTVRPCVEACGGDANAYSGGLSITSGGTWTPALIDGTWYNLRCGCASLCDCSAACSLDLAGPVHSITDVTIDGVSQPLAGFRVDNGRTLVRDGADEPVAAPYRLVGTTFGNNVVPGPTDRLCVTGSPTLPATGWTEPEPGCYAATVDAAAFAFPAGNDGIEVEWTGPARWVLRTDAVVGPIPQQEFSPTFPSTTTLGVGEHFFTARHGGLLFKWEVLAGTVAADGGGVTLTSGDRVRVTPMRVTAGAGECWPRCQDLGLPAGEPGTWSVTYKQGIELPAGGRHAISVLACEHLKACDPSLGPCRLPQRVQTITRQGVSMVMLDSGEDLWDRQLTGLPEVDMWLRSLRVTNGPGVWSVDSMPTDRHGHSTSWRG